MLDKSKIQVNIKGFASRILTYKYFNHFSILVFKKKSYFRLNRMYLLEK